MLFGGSFRGAVSICVVGVSCEKVSCGVLFRNLRFLRYVAPSGVLTLKECSLCCETTFAGSQYLSL